MSALPRNPAALGAFLILIKLLINCSIFFFFSFLAFINNQNDLNTQKYANIGITFFGKYVHNMHFQAKNMSNECTNEKICSNKPKSLAKTTI